MENVLEGDDIDLERFPTPIWHPKDGGRYIGTASMNMLRDPDSDWVNVGHVPQPDLQPRHDGRSTSARASTAS